MMVPVSILINSTRQRTDKTLASHLLSSRHCPKSWPTDRVAFFARLPRGSLAELPTRSICLVIESSGSYDIQCTDLYVYDVAGAIVDSCIVDSGDGARLLSLQRRGFTATATTTCA
mmetsp:Transcript_2615/g.8378  ORF Transcript_2615/g.8378 Transcript_2615/m.8378 type:complete len:116 (-) Transcript_2615:514-861(-)